MAQGLCDMRLPKFVQGWQIIICTSSPSALIGDAFGRSLCLIALQKVHFSIGDAILESLRP